ILPRPPSSTLFPYTTLFRSQSTNYRSSHTYSDYKSNHPTVNERSPPPPPQAWTPAPRPDIQHVAHAARVTECRPMKSEKISENRSEEHTSELQSRENLVCRL